jgi:hypothetical protein
MSDQEANPTTEPQEPEVPVILEEDEAPATRRRRFARLLIPPGAYALSELTGRPVDEILQGIVDSRMSTLRGCAGTILQNGEV